MSRRQAVILAGGLGTRMLPRTERIPKFLLPVAGVPFAALLLERLAASGYAEALVCIAHLGELVRDFVGDGRRFGLEVRYADEGPRLLGTSGALRAASPLLDETFLVTYGDSFLPFDYAGPLDDLRAHPGALGTMAVYRNEDAFDASNAAVSGPRVVRYEKRGPGDPRPPGLDFIDYGATALRREVLAGLPEGPSGLDVLQRDVAARGLLRAFVAPARFYEIGSPEGLAALEAHLAGDRSGQGGRP